MTVKTGGRVRGLISRWLVRFEASQQIFRLVFLAVTAASTLTSALALLGMERYAPYVLGAGLVSSPIFAYAYVETGVYNRKNRERMDRGDNFAGPGMYMGNAIQAKAIGAAIEAFRRGESPELAAKQAVKEEWSAYRDGVDVHALESNGNREEVEP